ncbi:MAG: Gfo/Idh/MocA family oxidoreductase [Armatimonadota bacterium]|nr:Gfo/Idh/MocA family oxidoreductase [Armatimonadota bacterium]
MTPDGLVRVGVVGVGNFGHLHAEVLAALPGVRLDAVCDVDPQRVRQVAGALGGVAAFDSFDACLREADLDAVVLATPEDQHARQAVAAMERGWDVLVEKPVALNIAEALAVQEAARRTGQVAMVGTILRFSLPHRRLAEAVQAGGLGRVLHVRSARYISGDWFGRIGVHPALRATIHDVDLVLWLTGQRVTRVAAAGHVLPGEESPRILCGLLWLANGATAVVESHFILPASYPANTLPPERPGTRVGAVEVVGEAGIARLDDGGGLSIWSREGPYAPDLFVVPRVGGHAAGALRAELEHFVGCVASRTPSALAPLADSVHAVGVAAAMVRAMESGAITGVEDRIDEHGTRTRL